MKGSAVRSFVVYRLSALGDVVLTTGVLNYWHQQYGWRFTVVTRSEWASVFYGHPAVDKTIELSREQLQFPAILSTFRTIAYEHKGQGLIDLHGTLRSRLLALLWRGSVFSYKKSSLERRLFLCASWNSIRDWSAQRLQRWNVPQRYALAFNQEVPLRRKVTPVIFVSEEEKKHALHLLQNVQRPLYTGINSKSKHLVALHPYSTHAHKAWLPSAWQALANALSEANIDWFIIGRGAHNIDITGGTDFSNQTTLRETCALLEQADVLVTGDSGPMHLAGAVGTPVVALFGPTTKEWGFYPEGEQDVILESNMPCRPCSLHGSSDCPHGTQCMNTITPGTVMQAVKQIVAAKENNA